MTVVNQNTPETTAQRLERMFTAWLEGRREHSPEEARDLVKQIRLLQKQLKKEESESAGNSAG